MKIRMPEVSVNKRVASMVSDTPLEYSRSEVKERLRSEKFDLVIVGGGITGAYTALDASLRGYRVALVEKEDFASGTSSKSSKMVHGGLRYIEQGNLPLVRHSLLERQRLRRNAPHIVQRLPFLFPIMAKGGILDRRLAKGFEALLWTYDMAGGWREGKLHKKLSKNEVLARCPTLDVDELKYGLLYFDARADDARLTLDVARTAAYHGAAVLNYAKAVNISRSAGKITGVTIECDGEEITIATRCAVMASGVWLRDWTGTKEGANKLHVRPAKGVHVALDWNLIRNDCTVTIPVPGRTRRATLTRWGNVSILGTTDEDYDGDLDDVNVTRDEMEFLLEGAMDSLRVDLSEDDVLGSIAGCRPLVAPPGGKSMEVKRNHEIRVDDDGLVTVIGGKLTTSRHMAEQTVDAVGKVLGEKRKCETVHAYLLGGASFDAQASVATGGLAAHLAERFGTESMFVSNIMAERPELAKRIVDGHDYIEAEVVYAARHEMARTVDDVLSRRTRLRLYARDASVAAAPRIADLLQSELGFSDEEKQAQLDHYRKITDREIASLKGQYS